MTKHVGIQTLLYWGCTWGLLLSVGCGSERERAESRPDAGGMTPVTVGCASIGDRIMFGAGRTSQVAAVTGGYVVATEDTTGQSTYFVSSDGTSARIDPPPGRAFALTGDGATARIAGFTPFWQLTGLRIYGWQASAWTSDPIIEGAAASQRQVFTGGKSLALDDDGSVFATWTEGSNFQMKLWGMRFDASGLSGTPILLIPDAIDSSGLEVHTAFGDQGEVHVLTVGRIPDAAETPNLIYVRVRGDDSVEPATIIGPAIGSLGNIFISGLAQTSTATYVAEVNAGAIGTFEPGALTVFRQTGAGFEKIDTLAVDLAVADGLSITPLQGDAVAVVVTLGENNIDAAQSDDSVKLWPCTATGCGAALAIRDAPGTFYGDSAVAAHGNEGLVVWREQAKQTSDEDMIWGQRFRCQ